MPYYVCKCGKEVPVFTTCICFPIKVMDDAGFQVVEKNEGKFEVVKLEPVKKLKRLNSKTSNPLAIKSESSEMSSSERQLPVLEVPAPQITETKVSEISLQEDTPKEISSSGKATPPTSVSRTYTRVRSQVKSLKNVNGTETTVDEPDAVAALDPPRFIKSEPELNIVDEDRESRKNSAVKERSSKNTKKRAIINNSPSKTGRTVADNKSTKTIPPRPLLLELALKDIRCNFCGMIFPKSQDQANTLKLHFLQHKSSVVKVIRNYDGVTYRTDDDKKTPRDPKPCNGTPTLILNHTLTASSSLVQRSSEKAGKSWKKIPTPTVKDKKKISPQQKKNISAKPPEPLRVYVNTKRKKSSESSTSSEVDKQLVSYKLIPIYSAEAKESAAKLPRILRQKTSPNNLSKSYELLQQLRWSPSNQNTGKSHVVIGNTLIKSIKQTKTTEASNDVVMSDGEDDVEIVEETPELIVIDDNDEQDEVKLK